MSEAPPPAWTLSTALPVTLLPVRLETRFTDTELQVRIYPDDVHVDSHEPDLTLDESDRGKAYWGAFWRAGTQDEVPLQDGMDPAAKEAARKAAAAARAAKAAAWGVLATALGPERASWVARVLEPTNPADRSPTPVGDSADLPKKPVFPAPTLKPGGSAPWARAAQARALPTRWYVTGYPTTGGPVTRVTKDVRANLQVGPSPSPSPSAGAPIDMSGEQLPIEPGLRWLADFAEAENAGMAVRLPRPAGAGFSLVVAVGADTSATDAVTGATTLDGLLEAHYHTRGLEYVPPGAPSNNTASASSAASRTDPSYRAAYAVGHGQRTLLEGQSGDDLPRALGLPTTEGANPPPGSRPPARTAKPLCRARGADRGDAAVSRHMITALWGVTWGYFLRQMTGGQFTDEQLRGVRRHAQEYLRPDGPLSTLRIGRQPYGVLPVLPLARWTDLEGGSLGARRAGKPVVDLLQVLRTAVWEPSLGRRPDAPADEADPVPRVQRGVVASATVARILGMSAVSQRLYGRSILGGEYVAYLWRFSPEVTLPDTWRTDLAKASKAYGEGTLGLTKLGLASWDVRLGDLAYSGDAFPLTGPLVGGDPAAYLSVLGADGLKASTLRDTPERGEPAQTPLLYRLLRHSLLVEHAVAEARISGLGPVEQREPELVDVIPSTITPRDTSTIWRRLGRVVDGRTIEDTLAGPPAPGAPLDDRSAELREARAALSALGAALAPPSSDPAPPPGWSTSAADVERLMMGTLDTTSHRLDAWITSFATRRLRWMRATRSAGGTHVGGYGWVTDVVPRAPATPLADAQHPLDEGQAKIGDLYPTTDSAGFVHAPSLAHATTAAVLRAGHRAHGDVPDGPLAIDLPSHRLRAAAWILDGVRQGQALGALLGYRFERALQEHPIGTLAAYIDDFRARTPVAGTGVTVDGTPQDAPAPVAVVDGLALHRRRTEGTLDLTSVGVAAGSKEYQALTTVLDQLDDLVDAVADALLAESVHQAVRGNPLRAGATLDATSRGEAPPPELDVARTPRTGVSVTHRVLVTMGAGPPPAAVWPTDPETQVRAAVAPGLNAWLATLLPAPGRVRVRVAVANAADPAVTAVQTDLADLRLSPLDYLAMIDGGEAAAGPQLEMRLRRMLAARPEIGPGATLTVDVDRDPAWAGDVVDVAELMEALRSARELLRASRPLGAADLAVPEEGVTAPATDADLADRAALAEARLRLAEQDLRTAPGVAADPAALRRGLRRAAAFGVPGALAAPGADNAAVAALAGPVYEEVARRLQAGARTAAGPDADTARVKAMLGADFPVLRRVTPPAAVAANLDASAPGSAALDWLEKASRVRAGAERLWTALGYAEALGTGDTLRAQVAQLPFVPGERWLGLDLPSGASPSGSRVSLVIHSTPPSGLDRPVEGLAVDEWTEVLPSRRETTGVAVHTDSPNAAAPHAILLAVPPDDRGTWTPEMLRETVEEALSLARIRAVDGDALNRTKPDLPSNLADIGQLVPAAMVAVNTSATGAVSTDFTANLPA